MVPDHWSNDAMVSMDRCGLERDKGELERGEQERESRRSVCMIRIRQERQKRCEKESKRRMVQGEEREKDGGKESKSLARQRYPAPDHFIQVFVFFIDANQPELFLDQCNKMQTSIKFISND